MLMLRTWKVLFLHMEVVQNVSINSHGRRCNSVDVFMAATDIMDSTAWSTVGPGSDISAISVEGSG